MKKGTPTWKMQSRDYKATDTQEEQSALNLG